MSSISLKILKIKTFPSLHIPGVMEAYVIRLTINGTRENKHFVYLSFVPQILQISSCVYASIDNEAGKKNYSIKILE
jgi:hypothetical protein